MPETVQWTHANGTISLHGTDTISILRNRTGLDAPPFQITRVRTPGGHGSRVSNVYVSERIIMLPLLVRGTSVANHQSIRRNLNRYLNPIDGAGYFTWVTVDGKTRQLNAYYLSGLGGNDELATPEWAQLNLSFVCVDPFWYDATPTSGQLSGASPVTFFTVPFLPLNIGEASIDEPLVVTNSGDMEAWPTITVEGPCSGVSITNDTTGKTIDLTGGTGMTLTAGQIATITTKPGERAITRDDATNLFSYLTADSTFFSLAPGSNSLSVVASGTSAATEVTISYYNTYTIK